MLKQEIIEKITKYFKLTHFEAEKIYDDIFRNVIDGVKHDNIADITNLGEFIVKYDDNNQAGHKKTVEFLPSSNFEEEVSETKGEGLPLEQSRIQPDIVEPVNMENKDEAKEELKELPVNDTKDEFKEEKQELPEELKEEVKEQPAAHEHHDESLSVEDEMKRKREQIINKLNPQHDEEYHKLLHVEGIPLNVPKPFVISGRTETPKEEITGLKEETKTGSDEIKNAPEEVKDNKQEVLEPVEDEKKKDIFEEPPAKSFSDYFSEIKNEEIKGASGESNAPPAKNVIPPAAVELHNEIVNEQIPETPAPEEPVAPEPVTQNGTGNGYSESDGRLNDNSYYIWYKDSEPNAVDTQTMSYEYELLYQATKEAEYKSKLRIYVTTFILFFSIVLLLLIFSPVIYKFFFTPQEKQNEEVVQNEGSSDQGSNAPNNKANVNTLEQQNTQTNPPATTNEKNSQQQNTQTQPEQKAEQNTPANVNIPGITKTDAGWKDEKLGVTYVQLENGKFTIQESAWNSEEKANNRVNVVNSYNIAGLKGNVVKVDLGEKGTWYRVRLGEFGSVEEAKPKAEELRKK